MDIMYKIGRFARKKLIQLLPESSYKDKLLIQYVNTINNIVVIVGQNCTLKCRNCANFSPYLAKQLPFYPYEEIIADIQALITESRIAYLQFQGGEFFLHPHCKDILEFVAKQDRIRYVCVATNATIIPKDPVLKLLQHKKFFVRVSDYGEVNAKSAEKLEEMLDKYGVAVIRRNVYRGEGLWSKCGDKYMKRLPEEYMQKVFDSCTFAKECLTMENGFITRCSRATISHIVQNFSLCALDGIHVRPNAQRIFDTLTRFGGGGGGCCLCLAIGIYKTLYEQLLQLVRAIIVMVARESKLHRALK
ncbi:radical SAM protein [Helicobacter typhlonius]|uniref:radical SAM protein n=1 Tax=Helicobacter typhlonius TaxID=76936 RepID=UPI002FE0BECA